ncbi:protein NRT1/ PTR FAMILY 5.6-like [Chenopodium quinoa]|uniref:protein NRT1/ PTR FAMILY 5.6-like n=1 Tax=Chenopodium quinoa TaxID=63459 RepID=UPI000B78CEC0|nr:protein NRT1/ PTR FAMILY 5.6-like [Chenopodium quinoa]
MATKEEESKEQELVKTLTNHAAEEEDRSLKATEALDQEESEQQNTITVETVWVKLGKIIHGESIFLVGVHLSYYIADFQFKGLISTLTSDDMKMILFLAVLITNVQEGAKPLLVILVVWLADAYLGDCFTLIISSITYIIGMAMWYSALFFIEPNDGAYFWGFLIVGLLLIIVGQCGYDNYTKEKIAVRKIELKMANNEEDKGNNVEEGANSNHDQDGEEQQLRSQDGKGQLASLFNKRTKQALKKLVILLKNNWIQILGFFIAVFVFPEKNIGMITLISMMFASSFIFLMGKLFFYPWKKPTGSPISAIFAVLWIAFKKRHDDSGTETYSGDNQEISTNGHKDNQICSNRFGCLNRAAMYDPTSVENPKVEFEKKRLCKVQQVKDTKSFIGCICLSLSVFLTYGVMTAVADTFFLEQADKMDTQIGSFDVPIQLFVYSSSAIEKLVSSICKWILNKKEEAPQRRFHGALRVGFGMLLSIPCFVIAAVVEDRKTSVLWLTPQLILVAIMDGIVVDGIKDFFKREMPELVGKSYGSILAEGVVGLGKLLSIVWFCLWYFATDWFAEDIQGSHLHKYYAVMAIFALCSCILYVLVASVHFITQSQPSQEKPSDLIGDLPFQKQRILLPSESLRHRPSAKTTVGTH